MTRCPWCGLHPAEAPTPLSEAMNRCSRMEDAISAIVQAITRHDPEGLLEAHRHGLTVWPPVRWPWLDVWIYPEAMDCWFPTPLEAPTHSGTPTTAEEVPLWELV